MPITQLERLKNDIAELESYAQKLMETGKTSKANNILKKREFMVRTLTQSGVQLSA